MAEPFVGEICIFGFNWAPYGWALCDGSTLAVQQNQALYSLIGITYGGTGTTTFLLPNLKGRLPLGQGQGSGLSNRVIGMASGTENVTLNVNQMPSHTHTVQIQATTSNPTSASPSAGAYLAKVIDAAGTGADPTLYYSGATPATVALAGGATGSTGSSLPITTMNPFLVLNFCIALQGLYPSRP